MQRRSYRICFDATAMMPTTQCANSSRRITPITDAGRESATGASVVESFQTPTDSDIAVPIATIASINSFSLGKIPGTMSIMNPKKR
jgi:hypothetical protein